MTLKKSSRDPFASLFWNSVKKTCFVPIVTLVILIVHTITNTITALNDPNSLSTFQNSDGKLLKVGFFWDIVFYDVISTLLLILGGILAALALFFFAQNKKRSNVIFSLGLSRRKIFLAKYLGGVLPLAVVLIFSALLELLANLICGCLVALPIIHLAFWSVVTMIAVYALTFTIVSVTTAFSGNIVESGIFSVIIGIFPNLIGTFIVNMRRMFTHGAVMAYESNWNFFYPFFSLTEFTYTKDFGDDYGFGLLYQLITGNEKITIYTWSGTITALVLTAVALTIALIAFPKHSNEISGTFGRARGLAEICGAMTALYAATFVLTLTLQNRATQFVAFISMIIAFILVYLIFKLVFNNKRKKIFIQSVKRTAAYATAIAVVTGIFATGCFGYSTYVPNAEDVNHLEIYMELTNPYATVNYEGAVHRYENFGYIPMQSNDISYTSVISGSFTNRYNSDENLFYPGFLIGDDEEIAKIIEIHKSLAKEGKLKANADNVCGYGFLIEYTLHGGKTVMRYYNSTSLENAIKLLGLSDLTEVKSNISDYFLYISNNFDDAYSDVPGDYCIYSKDLKKCRYVNGSTDELEAAMLADFKNLTAQQIFFHKPEDELGVINFSTVEILKNYLKLGDDEYVTINGEIRNYDTDEIVGYSSERIAKYTSSSEFSLSTSLGHCVIVTRDMKNTIKYLTDNNLMQYFKSDITANDVKKIKIATRAESVGRKNGDMLPLFAAGYATVEEVKKSKEFRETESHEFANRVRNSITDKNVIQTVLDNALLYGYNGNGDRVVEVTFNDGSIATYAISAEVYSKLNIK